jgi:hypothetical protein
MIERKLFTQKSVLLWHCEDDLIVTFTYCEHIFEKWIIANYAMVKTVFCTNKRDVLHRPLCADSDKIPEGWTSTYILHLSGSIH